MGRQKLGTALIMAAAVCLYVLHIRHSNVAGFGEQVSFVIDSLDHLDYIAMVAGSRTLPAPSACWECHQPPLYYVTAALPYWIAPHVNLSPTLAVRILSLAFYVGFLFFGVRLLHMEVRERPAYFVGLCLLVFWPYGVTKAGMISNDVPSYTAQAAALFYILRWRRDHAATTLAQAVLWNGIAITIKYSGILLTPFIAYVFVLESWRKHPLMRQLLARPVLLALAAAVVLSAAPFARTYYHYRIARKTSLPLLVPTVGVVIRLLPVPNDRLEYFVRPNLRAFRRTPFLDEARQGSEPRYFLNFVLKTSLFGLPHWTPIRTARAMTIVMVAMLAFMACGLAWAGISDRPAALELLPFVVFVVIQLAALVTYRLLYPHTANQDYRFIYPATIALTVLYAKMLTWHRTLPRALMSWVGAVLAIGFCGLSVAFFVLNSLG